MKKCLIYYEQRHYKNSGELLEAVRQIYDTGAYETFGVSLGPAGAEADGLFDCLIEITDGSVKDYDIKAVTDVLEDMHRAYLFDCILFPATQRGRMLAPRLAMRLHAGLVADVTAIRRNQGVLEIVRPAFGGKLMAGIISRTPVPLMMSVRQNVFAYEPKERKHTVMIDYRPNRAADRVISSAENRHLISENRIQLLEIREKEASKDIRDSEILISGGGGVMRDFHRLKELADELNAQVSASRKTIDSRIAPRSIQVGQSGKTVSPKLYMALGINGSIQHIEGLKNVETLISVNTNKNAPICSISDLVVEGDAKEFIDRLIDKIRLEKSKIGES